MIFQAGFAVNKLIKEKIMEKETKGFEAQKEGNDAHWLDVLREKEKMKNQKMKFCAGCGDILSGGIALGNTILCTPCADIVQDHILVLREEGKPVNVIHIAKKMFRGINGDGTSYILRDLPRKIWGEAKAKAFAQNQSMRDFLLESVAKNLD